MPKDYKNIRKKSPSKSINLHGLLPFLTGLTIGLFVAFIVYLNEHFITIDVESPEITVENSNNEQITTSLEDEKTKEIMEPQFDFYTILPKMEVSVSEWVADEDSEPKPVPDDKGIYILQVGSFKEFSAADEVKAKLALMGISADIQRVVINGRDVRHRVRIGPYKDNQKLQLARDQLLENKLDFMLLKLEVDNI
jgi:cell division protein FtsN